MKRLMIGALAALSAMLLLPALASATPAHVSPQPVGNFSIHGGASEWSRVAGGGSTGTTTTGTGTFENTTTGKIKLTFHGVKSSIGTNCHQPGGPVGTVTTTELTFHLVMLAANTPGILITGNETTTGVKTAGEGPWGHHFFDYTCGIFIPTVQWRGNGLLGTITAPACGAASNTAKVKFDPNVKGNGVQKHSSYTGTNYSLESSIGEGAYSASAMEAEATITFSGGAKPTLSCT
jgi:hypothetical protein